VAQPAVVVFGGTGFLGRAVVRRLAAGGWSVRAVSRRGAATFDGTPAPVEPIRADIRDDTAVTEALTGASAAVNAVGLYHPHRGCSFHAIHVEGAARLARAARAQGLESLVHISGIGADPNSSSAYVSARGLGEVAVREAFPAAVILRPSALFAARGSFLDGMIKALTAAPVFPLFGHGVTRLQPVFRDDVAEAVARVLDRPGDRPPLYELGGPRVLPYRELVEMLCVHLSRRPAVLPVPFALWSLLALMTAPLSRPPLTEGMVALMRRDNVADPGLPSLQDLGIDAVGLTTVLDNPSGIRPKAISRNLR
jgi:NADH dehydrogenase